MSDFGTGGSGQVAAATSLAQRFDVGFRIVAFGVWIGFIVFFLGLAINQGLTIPDDATHAVIAKCMASGVGYATTEPSLDREPGEPRRFDPGIGTGPAILLPCAAVLKIAGVDDTLPGIGAILVWASVMTLLWILIAREIRGISLLLGMSFFCVASLLVFAKNWLLWHALLGEISAAAYLLMGHWLLAQERVSRRRIFIAGVFLGLAMQTKYLAALLCTGALVMAVIRLGADRLTWKARLARASLFLLGCILPTGLWEAYKLSCLGYRGYLLNWRQFLEATHTLTVKEPLPFSVNLVQKRFLVLIDEFSINLIVWAVILIVILCLFRKSMTGRWLCLLIGLVVSSSVGLAYWGCFSMGWPRYAAMAVVLACFAWTLPIFVLPRLRQQALLLVMGLIVLVPAIPKVSMAWKVQQYVLFRPSKARQARAHVVAAIEALRQQGPIDLVCRDPGQYHQVSFDLKGCMNFNRPIESNSQPAPQGGLCRRIALINYLWRPSLRDFPPIQRREEIEGLLGEKIVSVLFSEDRFELVETRGLRSSQ